MTGLPTTPTGSLLAARCYRCDSVETEQKHGRLWCNVCWDAAQTAPRQMEVLAAALREISEYADAEWREGDKPYQFGIIARQALKDAGLL